MPFMTGHTLATLFIMAAGSGVFLRLVAKEKRRREKHLELRLQEKAKQLAEEEGGKRREAKTTPGDS